MTTRYVCLAAGLWLLAAPVGAQSVDVSGVRARGMGGAFTAVADDASATWWNPAGLAAGPYFNAVVEYDATDEPRPSDVAVPTTHVGAVSVAVPAIGFSYYHFRISEIRRSRATAEPGRGRQDLGPAGEGVLVGGQFGATVGQSVGDHLVVATTVKLLHGGPDGGDSTTTGSLDVGAIATFGAARVGLVVRDATEPTLGSAEPFTLARQIRAGAAVTLSGRGGVDAIVIASDADLATRQLVSGDERQVSAGAEVWIAKRRVGLRAGFSGETVGPVRPSGSAGGSIAIRSGAYVDASVTAGSDIARRGWSVGLRVTF